MKEIIRVRNFGPIEDAVFNTDGQLWLITGEQATGKSTAAKISYFCHKIKDYIIQFITEVDNVRFTSSEDYYSKLLKNLGSKFFGFFGTVQHMDFFDIRYSFGGDHHIDIKTISGHGNRKKVLRILFDPDLKSFITSTLDEYYSVISGKMQNSSLTDLYGTHGFLMDLRSTLTERIYREFGDSREALYIPAGRSLCAILSERLADVSQMEIDLSILEFIQLIRSAKSMFGGTVKTLIDNYKTTHFGNIKNAQLDEAYKIFREEILHADYAFEEDVEKIFYDEEHWIKLMFGSSGQQEALWIGILIMVMILRNKSYFVVIEEPEAHLFPKSQFAIAKMITLLITSTNSHVIVTTHSPYVLSSFNYFLFPLAEPKTNRRPKMFSLDAKKCRASRFYLSEPEVKTKMESILDPEIELVRFDYIDEISATIEDKLAQLYD